MDGPHIRYTDPTGKVTRLSAETAQHARRLYNYAVKVATAHYVIELMAGSSVLKRHEVVDV